MPERPYDDAVSRRRRSLNRLDPLPAIYQRLLRRVDRENTRSASTVLVNSRFMAEAVGRIYGVTPHVSYHGVDVEQFRPSGRERENFVLSVGSLTPLKGFDFLVRGMAQYRGANRPALLVASNFQNPPERAYLEGLARELGVELILRGSVSDAELVDLYTRARAVVYSPIREPFGLVPLEAMACATPVVTVAEGGTSESVIDGETGLLVPRDPAAFADAVRQIVEDPRRARALGESGRAHVLRHWTWDRAVATLEAHLQRAASPQTRESAPVAVLAR
jgi:glycosyltransferase involved in cell wall biosynthesis